MNIIQYIHIHATCPKYMHYNNIHQMLVTCRFANAPHWWLMKPWNVMVVMVMLMKLQLHGFSDKHLWMPFGKALEMWALASSAVSKNEKDTLWFMWNPQYITVLNLALNSFFHFLISISHFCFQSYSRRLWWFEPPKTCASNISTICKNEKTPHLIFLNAQCITVPDLLAKWWPWDLLSISYANLRICLDILRALCKEPETASAMLTELQNASTLLSRTQKMGSDGYIGTLERLKEQLKLADPMMLEGQAREVADELAISFQASCLLQYGDSLVAEAFLATRWSTNSRSLATSIGTASSSLPESALVEKMKVEINFCDFFYVFFLVETCLFSSFNLLLYEFSNSSSLFLCQSDIYWSPGYFKHLETLVSQLPASWWLFCCFINPPCN